MKKLKSILLVFMAVFFIGCGNGDVELPVQETYCLPEEFKAQAGIKTIFEEQVSDGIHLTGTVESNPDKTVRFTSLVEGIIAKTYFSLGDEVKKDQVLATIRSSELNELQSELRNIRAETRMAQTRLKSVESMFEDGIASQKDLLDAQIQLEIQQSHEKRVISQLQLYSGSEESGVFQLKAPSSGIITSNFISEGTRVSSEGELFTISDLNDVWITVNIYAANIQHIKTGMKVSIESLSYSGEIFEGEINAISQVLDQDAKVLKARIVMDNSDFKLKPGMPVDVIAVRNRDIKAISVPTDALVFDNNQNFVVVYKDDCNLEVRKVDILSANNGFTFLSSGLQENEQIITRNSLLVYEQINN